MNDTHDRHLAVEGTFRSAVSRCVTTVALVPSVFGGSPLVFSISSSRVADLVTNDDYCQTIGGPWSGDDPRGVVVGIRGYVSVPRNSQKRPERALRVSRSEGE